MALELEVEEVKAVNTNYGVVAIGRNEEKGIKNCLESIKNQTLKPQRIIFVNDGSTDKTKQIAESISGVEIMEFGEEHESWVDSPNLARVVNKGIIEIAKMKNLHFIITMGGDTIMPPNYAEYIIDKMIRHPEIVVASGVVDGEYSYTPRGTARVTNLNYWKRIGIGYKVKKGFEGYHFIKAGTMGLSYRVYDLKITSSKKTGEKYSSQHWYNEGYAAKALGYAPLYLYGKALILSFKKNPVTGFRLIKGFRDNKTVLYEKSVRDHVKKTQMNLIKYRQRELFSRITSGKKLITKQRSTVLGSLFLIMTGALISDFIGKQFIQPNWNDMFGYYIIGGLGAMVVLSTFWFLKKK